MSWCMSLITSSFTREWAREVYVNVVYSMFLCFYEVYGNILCFLCSWVSKEETCASL